MPVKVIMPQLGESVVEGTVTKWLKSTGDKIDEYEPLLEVNTDKVDSEIPSPASGTVLATLVSEGTTVTAGTVLAWIGQPGESIPEGEPEAEPAAAPLPSVGAPASEQHPVPSVTPSPGRDRDLGFISPVVARIASESNVDLFQVPGTGQKGRITKKDILAYIERRDQMQTPVAAPPMPPPTVPSQPALPRPPAPASGTRLGEMIPLTPVRQAIAQHMVLSKHTSPHVTTVMEVDLSRIVTHRAENKVTFAGDGVNLTFTAYFVAAAAAALKTYPIVNSSWSDEGIQLHREINIGMATSLGEEGLIVPVIKNADSYSLLGLARLVNDLANRARSKKLQPEEVKGGTFTITNHGISGSLFATPIINQPQCGILGVGAIQKRVVVISDKNQADAIAIRPMAYLTLTFDHRILDGAIADYFLGKVVEYLRDW